MRHPLRASPVLTLLTAAVHAAAAAVLAIFLPAIAGALAASLVAALGVLGMRHKTLLWAASAPVAIELGRDGHLRLLLRGGGRFDGAPDERRFVHRWLVVMNLVSPSGARRTLLVARDMLPATDFRQLRLWALWKALPGPSAAAAAAA